MKIELTPLEAHVLALAVRIAREDALKRGARDRLAYAASEGYRIVEEKLADAFHADALADIGETLDGVGM